MEELLTLFMTGHSEEGNQEVLSKGINLFRSFVSEDFDCCVEHSVKNGCSVWDYLPESSLPLYPGFNELWVDYLIRVASRLNELSPLKRSISEG